MASSRNSKSKSTGLRILWIPGGRKSHPKGRYDSTNKQVSYATGSRQKKSEVWSLGGSRAQKDLLNAEPDTSILDGPSVSGLSPIACATAGAAATCAVNNKTTEDNIAEDNLANLPITPNSTSSTAPLISIPNSPNEATALPTAEAIETTDNTMPAKTTLPTITVTTTTAEIIESRKNRFALLNEINCNDIDTFDLPMVPKFEDNLTLDTSAGTTASTATSPSTSPRHNNTNNGTESPSPNKKKNKHRNHNNNQGDVNSIESISDNKSMDKTIRDLSWIDDLNSELNNKPVATSKSKNKKKKKHITAKEMDQLDGVPIKSKEKDEPPDDEKVVKCLYYTLMCCDCTIS